VVVEATDGATVGSVRWLTAKNDRDTAAGAVVSAAAGATDGIALGSLWVWNAVGACVGTFVTTTTVGEAVESETVGSTVGDPTGVLLEDRDAGDDVTMDSTGEGDAVGNTTGGVLDNVAAEKTVLKEGTWVGCVAGTKLDTLGAGDDVGAATGPLPVDNAVDGEWLESEIAGTALETAECTAVDTVAIGAGVGSATGGSLDEMPTDNEGPDPAALDSIESIDIDGSGVGCPAGCTVGRANECSRDVGIKLDCAVDSTFALMLSKGGTDTEFLCELLVAAVDWSREDWILESNDGIAEVVPALVVLILTDGCCSDTRIDLWEGEADVGTLGITGTESILDKCTENWDTLITVVEIGTNDGVDFIDATTEVPRLEEAERVRDGDTTDVEDTRLSSPVEIDFSPIDNERSTGDEADDTDTVAEVGENDAEDSIDESTEVTRVDGANDLEGDEIIDATDVVLSGTSDETASDDWIELTVDFSPTDLEWSDEATDWGPFDTCTVEVNWTVNVEADLGTAETVDTDARPPDEADIVDTELEAVEKTDKDPRLLTGLDVIVEVEIGTVDSVDTDLRPVDMEDMIETEVEAAENVDKEPWSPDRPDTIVDIEIVSAEIELEPADKVDVTEENNERVLENKDSVDMVDTKDLGCDTGILVVGTEDVTFVLENSEVLTGTLMLKSNCDTLVLVVNTPDTNAFDREEVADPDVCGDEKDSTDIGWAEMLAWRRDTNWLRECSGCDNCVDIDADTECCRLALCRDVGSETGSEDVATVEKERATDAEMVLVDETLDEWPGEEETLTVVLVDRTSEENTCEDAPAAETGSDNDTSAENGVDNDDPIETCVDVCMESDDNTADGTKLLWLETDTGADSNEAGTDRKDDTCTDLCELLTPVLVDSATENAALPAEPLNSSEPLNAGPDVVLTLWMDFTVDVEDGTETLTLAMLKKEAVDNKCDVGACEAVDLLEALVVDNRLKLADLVLVDAGPPEIAETAVDVEKSGADNENGTADVDAVLKLAAVLVRREVENSSVVTDDWLLVDTSEEAETVLLELTAEKLGDNAKEIDRTFETAGIDCCSDNDVSELVDTKKLAVDAADCVVEPGCDITDARKENALVDGVCETLNDCLVDNERDKPETIALIEVTALAADPLIVEWKAENETVVPMLTELTSETAVDDGIKPLVEIANDARETWSDAEVAWNDACEGADNCDTENDTVAVPDRLRMECVDTKETAVPDRAEKLALTGDEITLPPRELPDATEWNIDNVDDCADTLLEANDKLRTVLTGSGAERDTSGADEVTCDTAGVDLIVDVNPDVTEKLELPEAGKLTGVGKDVRDEWAAELVSVLTDFTPGTERSVLKLNTAIDELTGSSDVVPVEAPEKLNETVWETGSNVDKLADTCADTRWDTTDTELVAVDIDSEFANERLSWIEVKDDDFVEGDDKEALPKDDLIERLEAPLFLNDTSKDRLSSWWLRERLTGWLTIWLTGWLTMWLSAILWADCTAEKLWNIDAVMLPVDKEVYMDTCRLTGNDGWVETIKEFSDTRAENGTESETSRGVGPCVGSAVGDAVGSAKNDMLSISTDPATAEKNEGCADICMDTGITDT
jgi:hypothetical protein